jgi:hypothetical protein
VISLRFCNSLTGCFLCRVIAIAGDRDNANTARAETQEDYVDCDNLTWEDPEQKGGCITSLGCQRRAQIFTQFPEVAV